MANVFKKPEIPQEDPSVVKQREQEQERAERERLLAIQQQLQLETQQTNNLGISALRRRGLTSLLGSG